MGHVVAESRIGILISKAMRFAMLRIRHPDMDPKDAVLGYLNDPEVMQYFTELVAGDEAEKIKEQRPEMWYFIGHAGMKMTYHDPDRGEGWRQRPAADSRGRLIKCMEQAKQQLADSKPVFATLVDLFNYGWMYLVVSGEITLLPRADTERELEDRVTTRVQGTVTERISTLSSIIPTQDSIKGLVKETVMELKDEVIKPLVEFFYKKLTGKK